MSGSRLRAFAEVRLGRQRSPQNAAGPHMVRYLRAANVKAGALDLTDVKEMNFGPTEQDVFALRRGDVLVTEGAGSLNAVGASTVWNCELEGVVCIQNTLVRLRPRSDVTDPRYLFWWAQHAYASKAFASIAGGVNIFHLGSERVGDLPADFPSLAAQREIADFLDAETARIDVLLELRQKQSELVTERHVVARDRILGVDRTGTRTLAPLRAMVTHIIDTAHATAPQSDSGTHSVIRTSEIRGGRLFIDQAYKTDDASYRRWTARGRPAAGDVLLTREAPAGEACVVPPNAEICIGQRVVLLRVNRATAVPEFLVEGLYARPARDFLRDMGRETTVSHLNMGDIPRIPMPNTSLNDQHSALRSLAGEAALASGLAHSLKRQRNLLHERRQALITAAVTRQIDVSTANGRGVPA